MAVTASDPLLAAALDCVDEFYARLFRNWPTAVTRREPRYTLAYSGDQRLTGANHLWPRTPDAITPEALADAERFFEDQRAAWSVVYTDTFMGEALALLHDQAYYPRWDSPLMVLDRPPHPLPVRRDAKTALAETERQLDEVTAVMAEAFVTGSSVNRRVVRPAHLHEDDILHYLIYGDGTAVASATVALHANGLASIWNVGTRYRYRRQRYATTLMLAVLDDLRRRGYRSSVLMASSSGQPLYEQLGYRSIGRTVYLAPPITGHR